MLNLLKIIFQNILQLIEQQRYYACLRNNAPYFGKHLAASQGDVQRHCAMKQLAISEIIKEKKNASFNILEIGSWAGGSAITWAEVLKKYNNSNGCIFCVDPWESYLDLAVNNANVHKKMEKALQSNNIFQLFLHNINATSNKKIIKVLRGMSSEILPFIKQESMNLVYIDGSHTYSDVLSDIKLSIPLICEGGILCGDDLELELPDIDRANANNFTNADYILDPKTKKYFHPGVTLAVADSIGEVSSWNGFWAVRKKGGSWQKINFDSMGINNTPIPIHFTKL